jgi:hypothetical protein
MVTTTNRSLAEITRTPDVIVAEMMMDGSMIFIAVLAVNGSTRLSWDTRKRASVLMMERLDMIMRTIWDRMPTRTELILEPTPSDGVVLLNAFRTMRLKGPTVDLMCSDGKLCTIEDGVLVPAADAHESMEEGAVYEMSVIKPSETSKITLVKPTMRPLKVVPNSIDVVKRAIATATKDPTMNAVLLDITSMSFAMRERVYTMAQARASPSRKVIVCENWGLGQADVTH